MFCCSEVWYKFYLNLFNFIQKSGSKANLYFNVQSSLLTKYSLCKNKFFENCASNKSFKKI